MSQAIPVYAFSRPEVAIGDLTAEVSFVQSDGTLAKVVETIPVENGAAVYNGPPLVSGLFFAIAIRSSQRGLVFRSGPLQKLPGPPSHIVAINGAIFLYVTGLGFSLTEFGSDGLPEILVQNLQNLPSPLQFRGVQLGTDSQGHYSVRLDGATRIGFLQLPFSYTRLFGLMPSVDAGRSLPVVIAQPFGSPPAVGLAVAPYRGVLDALMKHAVEQQLNAALFRLANLDLSVSGLGSYGSVSLVSVSSLSLFPVANQAQLDVGGMGGGWITGTRQVQAEE